MILFDIFIVRKKFAVNPAADHVFEVARITDDLGLINDYRVDGRYYTPQKVVEIFILHVPFSRVMVYPNSNLFLCYMVYLDFFR